MVARLVSRCRSGSCTVMANKVRCMSPSWPWNTSAMSVWSTYPCKCEYNMCVCSRKSNPAAATTTTAPNFRCPRTTPAHLCCCSVLSCPKSYRQATATPFKLSPSTLSLCQPLCVGKPSTNHQHAASTTGTCTAAQMRPAQIIEHPASRRSIEAKHA